MAAEHIIIFFLYYPSNVVLTTLIKGCDAGSYFSSSSVLFGQSEYADFSESFYPPLIDQDIFIQRFSNSIEYVLLYSKNIRHHHSVKVIPAEVDPLEVKSLQKLDFV